MNLYTKKLIKDLIDKNFLKRSDINKKMMEARYPVDVISEFNGVLSACFSPDCIESADEIIEIFSDFLSSEANIKLEEEKEFFGGDYEILFSFYGETFQIKERLMILAYYSFIKELVAIFNKNNKEFQIVVDLFSVEEVYCVLLPNKIANIIENYQRNINYKELNIDVDEKF